MTLENIIKRASQKLKSFDIQSCNLDAEIILSNVLGTTRESLITKNKINISTEDVKKYDIAIERRTKNEPVAYILGKKEFWSKDYVVNYSTLIPRPESELLIYKLINYYNKKSINILDVGTGSGCILLSLLQELNLSRGTGIDISSDAIKVAKVNSKRFKLEDRSVFKVNDINFFNEGKYDLIVSNPPYIASKDIQKLSKDIVNYEPLEALNGGADGLDLIKKVIYKSKYLLENSGLLAIEIGTNQYMKVSELLRKNGFKETAKEYDYFNNVRCIISTKM